MTGNDNIRISKVVREFNIGLGTLVEFLNKKGIEIEANPNAKLSAEAYELIEKAFKKDHIVKAELSSHGAPNGGHRRAVWLVREVSDGDERGGSQSLWLGAAIFIILFKSSSASETFQNKVLSHLRKLNLISCKINHFYRLRNPQKNTD